MSEILMRAETIRMPEIPEIVLRDRHRASEADALNGIMHHDSLKDQMR